MALSKIQIIGNLGRDPELRYTKSGQAVANFTLATTENWTRDGNREERTEWHRVVAWGKTAELCTQYLTKGRTVYIEGQIRTREWEDKEGHKRQTTEIHAQTVQFLGSGPRSGSAPRAPDEPAPAGESAATSAAPGDDEIPF